MKCFRPRTECLVIKAFNGELFVTIGEKIYELRKLETHKKYSKEFDEIPLEKKEKKKYIPPMSHPWKLASFKEQIERAHEKKYMHKIICCQWRKCINSIAFYAIFVIVQHDDIL